MHLPPIDLTTIPSKYYINLHPTESIMSSSANSANEWWDKVDYSDEEVQELKCAREGRKIRPIRTQVEKSEEIDSIEKSSAVTRTFPMTLEMKKERQARELAEEETNRAEIISKLEKKMVSLYNLKRQYQRTLGGEGCQRIRTSLPPLAASDKLTRQRDSLISRIKRKKLEDEVKMKKQIERKINIVKTLLNEQKQKEKDHQKKLKERLQFTHVKAKEKEEFRPSLIIESEETSLDIVDEESEEVRSTEGITSAEGDLAQDYLEQQILPGEVPESLADYGEVQSPEDSPKKSSKSKRASKKKSSEKPSKKDKKPSKKKEKKGKEEIEEAPAICETPPELPASQMADLTLWFANWRENIREQNWWKKYYEDQQLPFESEVILKPSMIVFKNVVPHRRIQQVVGVTNVGREPLQCRVLGVHQPSFNENSPTFQTTLSGPSKARTGHYWSLTVTLESLEEVVDEEAELLMLFCRGEMKTKLSVEVQVLTPRVEPTFSSTTIRFGPQMFWCSGPITKPLKISNTGSLSCLVYWTEIIEQMRPTMESEPNSRLASGELSEEDVERLMVMDMARDIVRTVSKNVFAVFRIDSLQPVTLPPKSQISLPVKFIPAFSEERGDVYTKFRVYFEGEKVEKDTQDIVVCGKIERSPLWLEPEVLNMKLCYVGGTVQQGSLLLYSSARHACQVVARVPRSLASVVSVVPRSTVVAAECYVKLFVKLVLGWDFLDTPCRYLEHECQLLMFPILVQVTDIVASEAPPLEATVIASVAPPCPLTVEPPVVVLGTVSTLETVQTELCLRSHCPRTYNYGFVDLPESITIEPGGGTGSILPLETLKLTLSFSPTSKDLGVACGRPGGEGEVNISLKCFTSISLSSPIERKKPQEGQFTKQNVLNNNRISSEYLVTVPTSLLPPKKVSRRESLHSFHEEDNEDESSGKVKFEDNARKSISEASFVYVPIDEKLDGEEMVREEIMGPEELGGEDSNIKEPYEGNYVTISEIKEEEEGEEEEDKDKLDVENLWDFYSTYQFGKSTKDNESGNNEGVPEKEIERVEGHDEADLPENKSIEDERHKSHEEVNADGDRNSKVVINNELQDDLKNENITTKDNHEETNKKENGLKSEMLESEFMVEDVDTDNNSDSNDSGSEKELEAKDSKDMCLLPETSQRFAVVSIKAYVMDPLVELSSQAVVLPPTPCTSYSIAHIYLRSRLQKSCSVHEKVTKFKTRFEFRSPSKDLIIEPKQGTVVYKQNQKISLIFSPKLNKELISEKALEMKVEYLKWQKVQDMLNEYNKAMEKKQAKTKSKTESEEKKSKKKGSEKMSIKGSEKKSIKENGNMSKKSQDFHKKSKKEKEKKSKGSVVSVKTKKTKTSLKSSKPTKKASGPLPDVVINPAEVEVTEEDLVNAEMYLLKYLEPYNKTLTLLCLLETDLGDGNRRRETLRCEVICPVVAPAIFLSTPACLDFGPVAVGASSKLKATITNLSFFDASVRLSTLNPLGPFICPAHLEYPYWKNGELELPPEHILTVPVKFQPTTSGEVVEAFEVISESTIIHLQARGRGVPLSFSFLPDLEVFMVTSGGGKKSDITISISNTCEAPLQFRICQEYLKEGRSLPAPKPEAPSPVTSPKQKKEKKGKGAPAFTTLNEELEQCLENDFVTVINGELSESVFKVMNTEENITVLSGETKPITIRFTLPAVKKETNIPKSPKSTTRSLKQGSKDNKNAKKEKEGKEDVLTINTKLSKREGKKNKSGKGETTKAESVSGKSERKDDVKTKQFFAAKFNVIFCDTQKVKDWVFIGTKK